MMIFLQYERVMEQEEARELLEGRSNLTVGFSIPLGVYEQNSLPTQEKAMVSIEGNDGTVYTGLLIRSANNNLESDLNCVILQFRFGENQPTESLDNKVTRYGFMRIKE